MNFKAINSIEIDGSEDDPDDNNDVFKYLSAIETLNDVEENATAKEVKISDAQPQDEFFAELAKLKAGVDNTQAAFIKAQDAHEQATDDLKNFLNDTAFKLKQKLDALPLDYAITLKKTSGATYHATDFSDI